MSSLFEILPSDLYRFCDGTIAVTGHRPNKLNNEWDMDGPLSKYIRRKLLDVLWITHPKQIITGMALGADMIFAEAGIFQGIPVLAAVPCVGQERRWRPNQQRRYAKILSSPGVTTHVVCPGDYAPEKMQIRNRWMVDRLVNPNDLLCAVWNGDPYGGTANCVEYARGRSKEMFRINPLLYSPPRRLTQCK